jgi:hypothetical protein
LRKLGKALVEAFTVIANNAANKALTPASTGNFQRRIARVYLYQLA